MTSTASRRSSRRYDVARLPFSLKILLENLLRNEDGVAVRTEDVEALATWDAKAEPSKEIAFTPARVILQDFTGVPCVVDLAAHARRDGRHGRRSRRDQPARPGRARDRPLGPGRRVRLAATRSGSTPRSEFERNRERYAFLRWGQTAFEGFKVVPPDTGIVHQVNLEYLARVVFDNDGVLYPDTLVGTDSHTTMINGLGVLGWGVGGIEAEAAMLGQPMSMLIPRVVGFRLQRRAAGGRDRDRPRAHRHRAAARARRRRQVRGVLRAGDREPAARRPRDDRQHVARSSARRARSSRSTQRRSATWSSPAAGRSVLERVEAYAKAQGLWHDENSEEPTYSETLELDLGEVVPSLAGPKRPQDRVSLTESKASFRLALEDICEPTRAGGGTRRAGRGVLPGLRPAGHQRHRARRTWQRARRRGHGRRAGRRSRHGAACRSRSRTARRPSSTTATW